jgi:hypothetical protein
MTAPPYVTSEFVATFCILPGIMQLFLYHKTVYMLHHIHAHEFRRVNQTQ